MQSMPLQRLRKAHKDVLLVLVRETADSLDMRLSDMDGLDKENKVKKKKFVDNLYSNAIVDARCALFKHLITIRSLRSVVVTAFVRNALQRSRLEGGVSALPV